MSQDYRVVNKDGKITIELGVRGRDEVLVGFAGTNIEKWYTMKEFLSGNTSDVVKVKAGQTFSDAHFGEMRTMNNGIVAQVVECNDKKRTVKVALLNGSGEVVKMDYSDFAKGNLKLKSKKKIQQGSDLPNCFVQYDKDIYNLLGKKVKDVRRVKAPYGRGYDYSFSVLHENGQVKQSNVRLCELVCATVAGGGIRQAKTIKIAQMTLLALYGYSKNNVKYSPLFITGYTSLFRDLKLDRDDNKFEKKLKRAEKIATEAILGNGVSDDDSKAFSKSAIRAAKCFDSQSKKPVEDKSYRYHNDLYGF